MADKTNKVIKPKALQNGNTIAIVSPSFRLNELLSTDLDRARAVLTTLGYRVKDVYSPFDSSASKNRQIIHRVEELHQAFQDESINAIVCSLGGADANELLRYIDFDLIRQHPKIFVGYSDISVLHLAIHAKTGLLTFYGPVALDQFAEANATELLGFSIKNFQNVLSPSEPMKVPGVFPESGKYSTGLPKQFNRMEDSSFNPESEPGRHLLPAPGWRWLRPGQCEGPILGGCLSSLVHVLNNPWWPSFRNAILLLETSFGQNAGDAVPTETVRAQLVDLANAGIFDQVQGLVVGRPTANENNEKKRDDYQNEYYQAFDDVLNMVDFRGPVLVDVDVGHTSPILTVPLGGRCELDSTKRCWKMLESVVS